MLSESDESDAHARDAAARAAPPATTIAALPHALLARVFACLPVDARLRCCEVCRGWRHVLATERSLWTALDLSETSGAMEYVTDALLRAAAAKASGALETLDVSGCDGLSHEALLEVVTVNAASLLEMRAAGTEDRTCKKITTLLRAAPRLRLLATDVACNAGDAARMLRNEDVLLPLRVQDHHVSAREADAAALHALAAALAALASPLKFFRMDDAHLGAVDVLDAVVDAALANRLVDVLFFGCALSAASAPSLARLLSGGALTSLRISQNEQLLDAPAAVLLGGALQTNSVLQRLQLKGMNFWRDLSATKTLLSSLVAHPSLRELDLSGDDFARWHAACAGAALFCTGGCQHARADGAGRVMELPKRREAASAVRRTAAQHAPARAVLRRRPHERGVCARRAAAGGARQHVADASVDGQAPRGRCRGGGHRVAPRCRGQLASSTRAAKRAGRSAPEHVTFCNRTR
jgi:hypothetical protein